MGITMKYDPRLHHRQSIRLRGYDYTNAGMYFITLCVQERLFLFGNIINYQMQLNSAGQMLLRTWEGIGETYPGVATDRFVIMPNHMHGIIVLLAGQLGPGPVPSEQRCKVLAADPPVEQTPLYDVIKRFKTYTATLYREGVRGEGWQPYAGKLWQRGYYEHIIRDAKSLGEIRYYIINNPRRWQFDRENPKRIKEDPFDKWLGICREE